MDRNFYNNDDFEEFLKQKADQYKMYPSDRVWNNIYSSLHGRRKWLIIGFILFFIGSVLFISRQAVLSNYTRMATQLNKSPEVLFSPAGTPAGIAPSYITALPLKTIDRYSSDHTAAYIPSVTISQSAVVGTPVTAGIPENKKVALLTATESGQLMENNDLLLAVPALNDRQPAAAGVKQLFPAVSSAQKTTVVRKDAIAAVPAIAAAAPVQPAKAAKWFLQLYASPTISYRRLSAQDQPGGYMSPVASNYGNVNQYVHHKPATGFEAGGNIQYKLSNNLSVYTGLQLNYSRYYIDAYKYHTEKASIALNTPRSTDTLSGYTDIRNFSGDAPEQLQNQYWQLSVPIGIQIKLLGDKKLQLNVAGGIQPTFLIHSHSFLISSDYKNYIQSPDLARSFNVHTNFEAFLSYQTKGIKWQLGPQFRSQLLSSYSNQYRVREYLTEFGIKFGITKTIR